MICGFAGKIVQSLWFRLSARRYIALLLPFGIFVASAAWAQQTINVPADAPTVQAAINEASNGDTILVAPGTYDENINFNGKAITIKGSGAASATILDGQALAAVVTFDSGEGRESVLSNLTVQNGSPSNAPVSGVPIVGAGGIYINGAAPTIQGDVIQNNFSCGIGIFSGAPLIEGNTITGTTVNEFESCGGANLTSTVNPANGTAIFQAGYASDGQSTEIIGNTIENNNGIGEVTPYIFYAVYPSAIYLIDAGTALIENNIIDGNQGDGAVVVLGDSAPAIVQNLIYANESNLTGFPINGTTEGLLYASAGITIGIQTEKFKNDLLLVANNTIVDNQILYPSGSSAQGYIYAGSQSWVSSSSDQVEFANNIIVGLNGDGSAVDFGEGADKVLHIPKLDHNDVFVAASEPPYTCSTGTITPCDQTGTNGNISADPLFASSSSTSHYPYQLQLQSPAVDSGDNNVPDLSAEDIMGKPRIQNAKGLPTAIIDMGVYEYPGVAAPPPAPDFTLTANPNTLNLTPGQQGTVTVTLTPTSTFQGTVSLSCGTLPADVSCSFQPQQVSVNNGLMQTAQLTISASNGTSAYNAEPGTDRRTNMRLAGFLLPGCIAGILLLVQSRRLNLRARQMLIVIALLSFAAGISACGVTFNGYPGNYTVGIYGTANSGNLVHQTSLQLTVLK